MIVLSGLGLSSSYQSYLFHVTVSIARSNFLERLLKNSWARLFVCFRQDLEREKSVPTFLDCCDLAQGPVQSDKSFEHKNYGLTQFYSKNFLKKQLCIKMLIHVWFMFSEIKFIYPHAVEI